MELALLDFWSLDIWSLDIWSLDIWSLDIWSLNRSGICILTASGEWRIYNPAEAPTA